MKFDRRALPRPRSEGDSPDMAPSSSRKLLMELMKLRPNPLAVEPGGGGGGCDAAEEGFVPENPFEVGEVHTSANSIVMHTRR